MSLQPENAAEHQRADGKEHDAAAQQQHDGCQRGLRQRHVADGAVHAFHENLRAHQAHTAPAQNQRLGVAVDVPVLVVHDVQSAGAAARLPGLPHIAVYLRVLGKNRRDHQHMVITVLEFLAEPVIKKAHQVILFGGGVDKIGVDQPEVLSGALDLPKPVLIVVERVGVLHILVQLGKGNVRDGLPRIAGTPKPLKGGFFPPIVAAKVHRDANTVPHVPAVRLDILLDVEKRLAIRLHQRIHVLRRVAELPLCLRMIECGHVEVAQRSGHRQCGGDEDQEHQRKALHQRNSFFIHLHIPFCQDSGFYIIP